MDTYTKMMKAAIEGNLIKWEPKVGDWTNRGLIVETSDDGNFKIYDYEAGWAGWFYRKDELTWFPSIEQLMKMVPDKEPLEVLDDMTDGVAGMDDWFKYSNLSVNNSVQELLLTFIIHELYGKRWERERWESMKLYG